MFYDIPQGSVLEPLLFAQERTLLRHLIHSQNLDHHVYVDDTQVYASLSTANTDLSLTQLDDCFSDISDWMTTISRKLIANKTDLSIIDTSWQRNKHKRFFPMPILNHGITPAYKVRNLGVIVDSNFNFRKHISLTFHWCYYHIGDHIGDSLLVGLIAATLFCITSHLRIF